MVLLALGYQLLVGLALAHGRHHQAVALLDVVLRGADGRADHVAVVVEAALAGLEAGSLSSAFNVGFARKASRRALVGEDALGEQRPLPMRRSAALVLGWSIIT
jgi:hypothetical protein